MAGSKRPLTFCSCSAGRRSGCRHLKELEEQIREFRRETGTTWFDLFGQSGWFRLAQTLFQENLPAAAECTVSWEGAGTPIRLFAPNGVEVLAYSEQSPATIRFLERIGKLAPGITVDDRSGLIERLSTFMRTPEEQHLNKAGLQTNRQFFEGSLWCRVAYHALREYGDLPVGRDGDAARGPVRLRPLIERASGTLFLELRVAPALEPRLRIAVPRRRAAETLALLAATGWAQVIPLPAADVFAIGPDTRIDEKIRFDVLRLAAEGEELLDEPERERYRYGDLAYIDELGVLVRRAERDDDPWREPAALDLEPARIPTFNAEPCAGEPQDQLDENPQPSLGILTEYDYIEIEPERDPQAAGEGSAVSDRTAPSAGADENGLLSIRFGFGDEEVALDELLAAKQAGMPFLETRSGWIDLNAPALRNVGSLPGRQELAARAGPVGNGGARVRMSSAELLRLQASSQAPIRVEGDGRSSDFLRRFLSLRPADPLVEPDGLKSVLRPYQKLGVEWLKFLYENGLAGLLCDDMGLGKTHQAMALMVILREQLRIDLPFLVVCPRTVISHWRNKLREYAPALHPVDYHGPQRDLDESLDRGDVVLTSYGVLRNDVERFADRHWGLAVFDEVQQIKNRSTQGYRAAAAINSRMKLGLTGTPIENSLVELKGLFDLVLPGYLGGDDSYLDLVGGNELDADSWYAVNLRRLTSPFVLRRVKTAVLDELPEKIEDTRTCRLSDEQLQMYRQTIESRGLALMKTLRSERGSLPYIHIFALLNALKQICDHPALAVNDLDRYENYESGKWDLCRDLLEESLDSGQKVVVFTQYLGMIGILERHLSQLGIDFVTLTGSTRERGRVVDRFNLDADCRVFLGSLKAGGTGIDLVGGSVVIHYDRWWNAAREDQATDRLHRIGQKRAVHVFKLITEDTIEERIADIIERKRRLMESVVQEDDPELKKIFSREELIELLQGPGLDDAAS